LRINRAATSVKWSPQGTKFAVTSGAKCVPVCHFEANNDWWIAKMIKKHKSTVNCVAWCCNGKFIVTGGCDMKCRIFSAYIENIDPADDDGFGEVFPNQHKFGEILAEFDHSRSWITAVAWAPSGFRVAFAGHGSTISFVQILAGSEPVVQTTQHRALPFVDMTFITDNTLVAVGYDYTPTTFTVQGGSDTEPKWAFQETFDKDGDEKKAVSAAAATSPTNQTSTNASPAAAAAASTVGKTGGFAGARAMFQNAAHKGTAIPSVATRAPSVTTPGSLSGAPNKSTKGDDGAIAAARFTRHSNVITSLQTISGPNGITKISTSGLDGRVLTWDLQRIRATIR